MNMINNTHLQDQQDSFQPILFQDQIPLVSECLLMAGAIKRHHEDAVVLGDSRSLIVAAEMQQVMEGADALLAELFENSPVNASDAGELSMVWNKLRHLVAATYQGNYFSNTLYN